MNYSRSKTTMRREWAMKNPAPAINKFSKKTDSRGRLSLQVLFFSCKTMDFMIELLYKNKKGESNMAAWSKLQKSLYLIVSDKVNFRIHCSVYRMKSQRGNTDLPRYWITIGKDIVFDYPKQFINNEKSTKYPYITQISDISDLIREYIDCPVALLPEKKFENDLWGLTDIFKAVDKRLGKERLNSYFSSNYSVAKDILKKRFE